MPPSSRFTPRSLPTHERAHGRRRHRLPRKVRGRNPRPEQRYPSLRRLPLPRSSTSSAAFLPSHVQETPAATIAGTPAAAADYFSGRDGLGLTPSVARTAGATTSQPCCCAQLPRIWEEVLSPASR